MAKNEKVKTKFYLILLFVICLVFFLPFLIRPDLLSTRNNDLGRTYIPLASFIKDSFYRYKQIPLWRPDQLMGETFIGNPLSSLFYPANLLFLIFPVKFAADIYLILHFFLAGIFTYQLASSFGFSRVSSFAAALFYSFSTKMLVHLSAGHITMIAAFSYFPLAFWAIRTSLKSPNFNKITLGAISLTFIYITYPTIFYYTIIFLFSYTLYYLMFHLFLKESISFLKTIKKIAPLFLVLALTFGLSAIVLLPQLEFAPLSTRSQLKLEDVAFPLWNLKRFLTSLFFPYLNFKKFDHESFLYLGLVPGLFAIIGFTRLSPAKKVFLTIFGILTLLFIAGLSSPLFEVAYNYLPFLKYSRITTRPWFTVALVVALLAAYALQRIRSKGLIYLLVAVFLIESFYIGYKKISAIPYLSFGNDELYQYIANDHDLFRVYCTTYCFNPQLASKYKIQILNGESPIQDANFVKFLAWAGGYHYDRFAVIFPPYQVWQKENPPVPDSYLLGLANVKYVASTYSIDHKDFIFINQFEDIYLYKNAKYKPRAYFEDSEESIEVQRIKPNDMKLAFEKKPFARNLIVSENFYPGWFAFIDNQKFEVGLEEPVFRKVVVPSNSESVDLKYQPKSLLMGRTITFFSVFALLLYFLYIRKRAK